MFERMEIAEYIYKDVVETSYKKYTWSYANRAGHIKNKTGGPALSKNNPAMGKSACKRQRNI